MIKEAIIKIVNKEDLTFDEAYAVMNEIMTGQTSATQNAAFLAALSTKSAKAETISEISGCAVAMREHAKKVPHDGYEVLEIVGTGGDNAHSFNISTTSAFIIAAAGILMFAKTPEVLFQNSAGKAGGALFFAGLVLLFLAGLFIRKKPKAVKKEQKADVPVDPDRCYAAMLAVCTVIDHEISSADTEERMRKRKQAEAESRLIPEEESELYSGLLEAAYSRDGEYALEKIGDLAFYLHKKGFSVVDFDDDHKAWFDFMPGEHTSTIRPAIAKDGVLVRKGLVSYGD